MDSLLVDPLQTELISQKAKCDFGQKKQKEKFVQYR